MINSKRNWAAHAALRTGVVVIAVCLLPSEFLYAQDFNAVQRRLGGAVEAGELSLEQASLMMEALRRASYEDRELEAKKHHYEQVEREIREAHEAGKISEEEAEEKLIYLRREMFEMEHRDDEESHGLAAKKRRYEQLAREIKEAHEEGALSEEEAEEKLIELRMEMFEEEHHEDDHHHEDEHDDEDEKEAEEGEDAEGADQ